MCALKVNRVGLTRQAANRINDSGRGKIEKLKGRLTGTNGRGKSEFGLHCASRVMRSGKRENSRACVLRCGGIVAACGESIQLLRTCWLLRESARRSNNNDSAPF